MTFGWDPSKAASNVAKHGLSFDQARTIFDGPTVTRESDRDGERRWLTFGLYEGLAVLAVAHTARGRKTRIISARPANRSERSLYHEAIRPADER